MIVIHVGTLPDSDRLSACYDDIDGLLVLRDPRHSEVKKVLTERPNDTVVFLGHGDAKGLWNCDGNGYLISSKDVYLLRDRKVVGIWCYASEFADKYGLHGFFTSMFISNLGEALMNGFYDTDKEEITKELDTFCMRIHHLLRVEAPLEDWVKYLQDRANIAIKFVRFNYEAMVYFE